MKTGVLLVNVGTPADPSPNSVGKYLKEFLMDPLVIDLPWALRYFLVHALIVPKRKQDSAKLYQKIWTSRGSPLMDFSMRLLPKVEQALGAARPVKLGMRYGTPSLMDSLAAFQREKIERLVVFPMYPQFSLAATESCQREVVESIKKLGANFKVSFVPSFYKHPAYLDAVASVSAPHLKKSVHDLVIFSFHGLPERQVARTDPSKAHCLKQINCCDIEVAENRHCYRHQCYETAKELAQRLQIHPFRYLVAFQSRLGRTPWIKPFTDEYYRTLPGRGIKRLLVLSPSFVTDCLETLEEIQIRGREEFIRSGGTELTLVPSLNDSEVWAHAIAKIVQEQLLLELPTQNVSKN